MIRPCSLAPAFVALQIIGLPAMAQDAAATTGDAGAGAAAFDRQCVSCHVIADADGEVLAGRNGRVGPNLHGVVGRQPGSVEDYRYSESLAAFGALAPGEDETGAAPTRAGLDTVVWAEANLVAYLQDPSGFLREALGDPKARSKMAYKMRDPQEAADLAAYLATFSPDAEMPSADAAANGPAGDAAPKGAAAGAN